VVVHCLRIIRRWVGPRSTRATATALAGRELKPGLTALVAAQLLLPHSLVRALDRSHIPVDVLNAAVLPRLARMFPRRSRLSPSLALNLGMLDLVRKGLILEVPLVFALHLLVFFNVVQSVHRFLL
jgi:hypothetical protein